MTHDLAVVISDMGSGGAQRVLSLLLEGWWKRGVRVCLITLADADADFFGTEGVVSSRVKLGGAGESRGLGGALMANTRRLSRLRRALRRSGAPVVLSLIGSTNVLTVLASAGLGKRVVISERNDPSSQSLGGWWDRARRWTYRRADLVTANSERALDALRSFVPDRKLTLVHNPVEVGGVREPSDEPVVLTVGRLTHQKAIDVILRAIAIVVQQVPNVRLRVAGTGPSSDRLRELASRLAIDTNVEWLGVVDAPQELYREARVFVLASRYEGTPNVLLEAMSWGVPCVVSQTAGDAASYIDDGRSGLLTPAEDPPALAERITRLLSDIAFAERLGSEGRAAVAHLDPATVTQEWSRLLGI